MSISWFCVWGAAQGAALDEHERRGLVAFLRGCPGLAGGHVMTPTPADDPYFPDPEPAPPLALHLVFDDIATLEDALRKGAYLSYLADPHFLSGLGAAKPLQQAMLGRSYAVAEPAWNAAALTYLVEYQGPPPDGADWHRAYMDNHSRFLGRFLGFPGVREIAIYTAAHVVSALPFDFATRTLRNRCVFDSADAMNAAMSSPARVALRGDFLRLPKIEGEVTHFPFATVAIDPM